MPQKMQCAAGEVAIRELTQRIEALERGADYLAASEAQVSHLQALLDDRGPDPEIAALREQTAGLSASVESWQDRATELEQQAAQAVGVLSAALRIGTALSLDRAAQCAAERINTLRARAERAEGRQ